MEQKNNRKPSSEELAEKVDMSLIEINEALKISGRALSIDAPLVGGKLSDVMPDDKQPLPDYNFYMESLQHDIEDALKTLDERERKIIELYYGFGDAKSHTLEEIGDKFE